MSKVIIFGSGSFAAKHMIENAKSKNDIFSFNKNSVDIRKIDEVSRTIEEIDPDYIVNFASITTVKESFENPLITYETSFCGMLNILNSLKKINFKGKILNISSSEVYGHPESEKLPIDEKSPLVPTSPYSVAKIATEYLCNQWSITEGFNIITARPFTHIGKYQSDKFSISSFSKQIAEIKLGFKKPELKVGDLSPSRDFTDVRDTVKAYWSLLENGIPGEIYNVCSNKEISMRLMLKRLIEISQINIDIKEDNSRFREKEPFRTRGSYQKLSLTTNWEPEINIYETLSEMIEYWLLKLSR